MNIDWMLGVAIATLIVFGYTIFSHLYIKTTSNYEKECIINFLKWAMGFTWRVFLTFCVIVTGITFFKYY